VEDLKPLSYREMGESRKRSAVHATADGYRQRSLYGFQNCA